MAFTPVSTDGVFEQYFKKQLITKGAMENGYRNGLWSFYYPNSQLNFQGEFANDLKAGEWKFYDQKGSLATVTEYLNGLENGSKSYFSKGGRKLATEFFSEGSFTGITEYYHENGLLCARLETNDHHRAFFAYHPNGMLRFETIDWKNKKNDTTYVYHDNGVKKEELTFYKNILLSIGATYDKEGTSVDNGNFKNGAGKVIRYFDNMQPFSISMYKGGLKNGIAQFYHPNGQIKSAGMFSKGVKIGVWKYYKENGDLENTIEHRGEVEDNEFTHEFAPDGLHVSKLSYAPQFPGGDKAFNKYLKDNLNPDIPLKNVEVVITIDLDEYGFGSNFGIFNDQVDQKTKDLILSSITDFPRCVPAFEDGIPVASSLTQVFHF